MFLSAAIGIARSSSATSVVGRCVPVFFSQRAIFTVPQPYRQRGSSCRCLCSLSKPPSGPWHPQVVSSQIIRHFNDKSPNSVKENFPKRPERVGLKPLEWDKEQADKRKEEFREKFGSKDAARQQDQERKSDESQAKDVHRKMSQGLAGVYAAETAIATVGVQGTGLTYRGYRIEDLATKCPTFEEVAFLLLLGHLPAENQLHQFIVQLIHGRPVEPRVKAMLELLPSTTDPMDVLRLSCSYIGCIDPEPMGRRGSGRSGKGTSHEGTSSLHFSEESQLQAAMKLFAVLPGMLFYWWHFHFSKMKIFEDSLAPTFTQHLFQLLFAPQTSKQINRYAIEALKTSLILYAEHELNASTFAARVTAGTLSDYYSCITTAIGTLKGPLHGGASEAAMGLLDSIKSENEVDQILHGMTSRKELIMGFGHRIYKYGDPRSEIIKEWARRLCEDVPNPLNPLPQEDGSQWQTTSSGDPTEAYQSEAAQQQLEENRRLFRKAEAVEQWMLREKKIHPNVDFYSAVVYRMIGIPTPLFTPIFALARLTGWSAHVFEQRAHNKLIRPLGLYVGPEVKEYVGIEDRKQMRGRL